MLNLLFESQWRSEEENHLDVVVIPALGLNKPTHWLDSTGTSWLQSLVDGCVARITVWEYVYKANLQDSVAKQLIQECFHLVDALHGHCTRRQHNKTPIAFVCHGSGGLVLKKALCLCRDRYFHLHPVAEVISGFIFLGSPHLIGNIDDIKKSLDLLFKCRNGDTERRLSSHDDVSALIEVCKTFERLGIQRPIVSAYESRETHISSGLFARFRSKTRGHMIVPESLSTLRLLGETLVDSKSNHTDICNIPIDGELYHSCENLITDVLQSAPHRIAENDKPYTVPSALKDETLRSLSTTYFTGGGNSFFPSLTFSEAIATDPKLPCFVLGERCMQGTFVGREDTLKILDDHLLPAAPSPDKAKPSGSSSELVSNLRSFAICGLGGIGKTELVLQYAHARKGHFEAIFWVSANDSKILASSFANMAVQLGLDNEDSGGYSLSPTRDGLSHNKIEDSGDVMAKRDIVMGWLSRPMRQTSRPDEPWNFVNWLLIFDNVDNLDLLDDYWPKLGRGSVLITSRDPNAKQNIYIHEGLHLPPLTNTETEVLLQKLTLVEADDSQKEALAKVAKRLSGLPRAISQMASVLRSDRLSYTDLWEFLQGEGIENLHARQSGSSNTQKTQSLATYWDLDCLSDPAKALLQVMCLLDPDGIPEDILIDKSGQVSLTDYPRSRGDYYSARRELLSYSLISQNRTNKLSLHRLVQDAAKSMMEKDQLVSAFQAASKLIVSAWPFQAIKEHQSTARFSKYEDVFPCVLCLKDGLLSILETSPDFPMDISLARLFNDTGGYMFEQGLEEETKTFCNLSLLIAERLKSTHGTEAIECIRESQKFLGIALAETNEHALSMAHKQKWLDMLLERKSDFGPPIEDYELGYAYNEIGVAYGNADTIDEATKAFGRSIEIFQGLDDYEAAMFGWPKSNLGFMYWLKGDLEAAEATLVEILDIHTAAWRADDTRSFETSKILYGLGNVLESQGRFDESLDFHFRCLEPYKKVLGMNHHRVGDVCHKIAGHYMRNGLHKEATEYLDTSLRIFESRSHLANELARTMFQRSKLHRLMGENNEADEALEKAYLIRERLKPDDTVPIENLVEEDFDSLVAFWSR